MKRTLPVELISVQQVLAPLLSQTTTEQKKKNVYSVSRIAFSDKRHLRCESHAQTFELTCQSTIEL